MYRCMLSLCRYLKSNLSYNQLVFNGFYVSSFLAELYLSMHNCILSAIVNVHDLAISKEVSK